MKQYAALVRTALASSRSNRSHTAALAIMVGLGSALMAAALVLGASMQLAVGQAVGVEYDGVDVVVSPVQDLARLAELDGVESVAGLVRTTAVAQVQGAGRGIVLESLPEATELRWQRWSKGRAPSGKNEVALTRRTLDELAIGVGDRVALGRAGAGRENYTVVGEIDVRGSSRHTTSAYGIVTAEAARALAGLKGDNVALIAVERDADADAVAARINDSTQASGAQAQTTDDLVQATAGAPGQRLQALDGVVTALFAAALLIAALLIAMVVRTTLPARRRAAALVRTAGGTRPQVVVLGLIEGAVPGLVGATIGTLTGIGLAWAVNPVLALVPNFADLPSGSFTVPSAAVGVPLLSGLGLAILSGLAPALLASRGNPAEAVRVATTPPRRTDAVLATGVAGVVLLGVAAALALLDPSPMRILMAFAAGLLGVLMVSAHLIRAAARAMARTRRVRDNPARALTAGLLGDRPRRAAGDTLSLTLACVLIAFASVALGSLAESSTGRLSTSGEVDLALGAATGAPLSDATLADLEKVSGVDEVVPLEFGPDVVIQGATTVEPGTVTVPIEDLDGVLPLPFVVRELDEESIYLPAPGPDEDVILEEGATVSLRGPLDVMRGLEVVHVEGLPIPSLVHPDVMEWVTLQTEPRVAWLSIDPGADRSRVLEEVTAVTWLSTDAAVGGAMPLDLRSSGAIASARTAALGLLVIAVLVALAGAVVVGGLSVRERRREYGVLRAIGMERPSLRAMLGMRLRVVRAVGVAGGLVTGAGLGLIVSRAAAEGLGLAPRLAVPWPALVVAAVLAVVVVLMVRLACVLPLERVFLARPARALVVG